MAILCSTLCLRGKAVSPDARSTRSLFQGFRSMSGSLSRKLQAATAEVSMTDSVASRVQRVLPGVKHTLGQCFLVPGLFITDHTFTVPLSYTNPAAGSVEVFVRDLVAPSRAKDSLPYLLYLQGGPGFESPRPSEASIWIKSAVNHFRVLLMDQRGTGLSSPVSTSSLVKIGSPEAQAEHLSHFRADNIVMDAEVVRCMLVGKDSPFNGRWSLLGQSFGGFCAVTYLSLAPEGLYEVLLTGGIPPAIMQPCSAEDVYRRLYARVAAQNVKFYMRFPHDAPLVARIVLHLAAQPGGLVTTPAGNNLTVRSFQMLGLSGLGTSGGFERLHYLLERAFSDSSADELHISFLKGFDAWMSWDTNPLYALIHEAIYCQGAASKWAAHRVRHWDCYTALFDAEKAANSGQKVFFTGEMVYPWMFDDFVALRPLKGAAEILAAKSDWPPLYNAATLNHNLVPVATATYVEDMYVDFDLAQETAKHIKGIRQWMTNEYMHSGIRDDGARIFEQLLGMTRGSLPLF